MKHSESHENRRVTIGEIAELGQVTSAAVSNWRKRHPDFPASVTPGSDQYRLDDVHAWMAAHGKSFERISYSPVDNLWSVVTRLRDLGLEYDDAIGTILQLIFIRRNAEKSGERQALYSVVWERILGSDNPRTEWQRRVPDLVQSNPDLPRVLSISSNVSNAMLRSAASLVAAIDMKDVDWGLCVTPFLRRYEEELGRRASAYATPPGVVDLVIALLQPLQGTIYDPACGVGMVLSAAWRNRGGVDLRIVGQEVSEHSWRLAFLQLAIAGADFELASGDTLLDDKFRSLRAQRIVVEPPLGATLNSKNVPPDDRWSHGIPAAYGDWLWVQHALYHMADDGMAIAALSPAALFRGGTDLRVRASIVRTGVLDAVIELPPGLFANTNVAMALLLFGDNARSNAGQTLFINGRHLGTSRRGRIRELGDEDIDRIVDVVTAWRAGSFTEVPKFAAAGTISQIEGTQWNLSPSRYIAIAPIGHDSVHREPIAERLSRFRADFNRLHTPASHALGHVEETVSSLKHGSVEWPVVKLADVLAITPRPGMRQRSSGVGAAVPFVSAKLVFGSQGSLLSPPDETTYSVPRERLVKAQDLLLVSRRVDAGMIRCVTVRFNEPAAYSEALVRLSPNLRRIDPDYLRLFLTSRQGASALVAATTGTTLVNLRMDALQEIMLPLPTIAAQREIARVFLDLEHVLQVLAESATSAAGLIDAVRDGVIDGVLEPRIQES